MAKRAGRQQAAKDIGERVIDATLELIVVHGWTRLTLAQISRTTGLSLEDLYREFPTKAAILSAFVRRIDTAMASAVDTDSEPEATARDRLFEVIMARFDALSPHKEAVRTLARDLRCDPITALGVAPSLRRSIQWMLECADLTSGGLRGLAHTNGLAAIYTRVFGTWLRDDSEDMAKTMASLDGQLARAESFVRRGWSFGQRRDDLDADAATM